MAFESAPTNISFEGGSTALAQFRFVTASSTRENSVVFPTTGAQVLGVMTSDYPSSTEVGKAVTVQTAGIAKVQAVSSTVAFGDKVTTNAVGRAVGANASTADFVAGVVVGGTSGGVDRILSVFLSHSGRD